MDKNRLSHKERIKELTEYLETCGYYNINKSALARKFKVSEAQIRSDFEHIMRESKPEDFRIILKKFDQSFSLALNTAINAISKISTTTERINCARCISSITREYLGALRQLGYNIPQEDGSPPPKPTIQQFIDFLESPMYKTIKDKQKANAPIPTTYENINFKPPVVENSVETPPQSQESILEVEEDDLIPIDESEDDEDEENHV